MRNWTEVENWFKSMKSNFSSGFDSSTFPSTGPSSIFTDFILFSRSISNVSRLLILDALYVRPVTPRDMFHINNTGYNAIPSEMKATKYCTVLIISGKVQFCKLQMEEYDWHPNIHSCIVSRKYYPTE